MENQILERKMVAFVKGSYFISATALAKFIGKEKDYAYRIVSGLEKIPGEKKGTKYFIPDVVKRIAEVKTI